MTLSLNVLPGNSLPNDLKIWIVNYLRDLESFIEFEDKWSGTVTTPKLRAHTNHAKRTVTEYLKDFIENNIMQRSSSFWNVIEQVVLNLTSYILEVEYTKLCDGSIESKLL